MAFTPITITAGPYARPDGGFATGKVTALLSEPMRNGTAQIDPTPVYGILNAAGVLKDASGLLPWILEANDDVGTTPVTHYQFTVELDSAPAEEFTAVIPHTAAAGTIDLSVFA